LEKQEEKIKLTASDSPAHYPTVSVAASDSEGDSCDTVLENKQDDNPVPERQVDRAVSTEQTDSSEPLSSEKGTDDRRPSRSALDLSGRFTLLLRRILAFAIDQLICGILAVLFLSLPLASFFYFQFAAPLPMAAAALFSGIVFSLCCFAAIFFQFFIYYPVFESSDWQATPGKFLMGLHVTDTGGNAMSYHQVLIRLFIQGMTIFALSQWVINVNLDLTSPFGPAGKLNFDLPILEVIGCYLLCIFTGRSQTLFDIFSRRIVAIDRWSISTLNWKTDLRHASRILLVREKDGPDWLSSLCKVWSVAGLIALSAVICLSSLAVVEANQAPWSTADSDQIRKDSHYVSAMSKFRELGVIYYIVDCVRRSQGEAASLQDLYKASMCAPDNWQTCYGYALALESNGQLHAAEKTLTHAIELRKKYQDGQVIVDWHGGVETRWYPGGFGLDVSMDRQNAKLAQLRAELRKHEQDR
jgi:uncharacterized RDD family membrane protein YckC